MITFDGRWFRDSKGRFVSRSHGMMSSHARKEFFTFEKKEVRIPKSEKVVKLAKAVKLPKVKAKKKRKPKHPLGFIRELPGGFREYDIYADIEGEPYFEDRNYFSLEEDLFDDYFETLKEQELNLVQQIY